MKMKFIAVLFVFASGNAMAQCGFANFNFSVTGFNASFIDNSVAGPGITIVSHVWDFGDGTTAFISNPIHTYSFPGVYNVRHTFMGNTGCNGDTVTKVILISAVAPVVLNKFSVMPSSKGFQLQWNSVTESNFSHFQIEKSADGILFNAIGSVYPLATKAYSFIDGNLLKSSNYYRLKMIDKDGTYQYSKTVSVNNQNNDFNFSILSNPIKQGEPINISLNNYIPTNTQVQLYDMTGSLKVSIQTLPINGRITINKDLAKGIYAIKIYQGQQQSSKLFVVQ